jgi:cytochrome c oxidase subunit 3
MAAVTTPEAETHEAHHDHELPYAERVRNNRLGLWLFCFSEIFLFVAFLAARFYLWRDADGTVIRPELNQLLGLATTSVLLISSGFMAWAEAAMAAGDRKTFSRALIMTFLLGLAFLIGVVGLEWRGEVAPGDGAFGAIFFGMTGIHALHVVSGLLLIAFVWLNRNRYTAEEHWGVEATAIYWHYVDVVWVFFYPALYLIGEAVHIG